ncbi:hypothetical protein ADL19_13455 [Streptomyces purpurogeneiscleroticus]|nr:hypothetical protein ADL19_13455 [Streptomyces purpurogeneiscleroticus]
MPSAPFGFGGILGGGPVPDVEMPDGLPVSGGKGSPLVDAFLALQGQRINDAVTAPRDAYTGDLQVMGPDGHPTAEAMDRANGLAGLAMTGSMPLKAPKGALRMFGGAEAHEDPLAALEASLASFVPEAPPSGPRFLDPAAKSWDLYHGSNAGPDFQRFDPNAAANPAERGGVFFAPGAETASDYARSGVAQAGDAGPRVFRTTVEPGKTAVLDLGHLAETDPAFNARARQIVEQQNGPGQAAQFDRYMEDFSRNRAEYGELKKQVEAMGYPASRPDPLSFGYGHIGAAIERAQAQGLDTAVLRGLAEHGGDDQVVALTPGRVRSYYDPSQVLFNGGPAGGLAGLPALAASSDPKGPPVSSGLAPFGALSAADIARLMQQARPQVGDEDVPAAIPPGFSGFVPPTAPTMQPPVAAPAQASEPVGPMQAPLRMFGSLVWRWPARVWRGSRPRRSARSRGARTWRRRRAPCSARTRGPAAIGRWRAPCKRSCATMPRPPRASPGPTWRACSTRRPSRPRASPRSTAAPASPRRSGATPSSGTTSKRWCAPSRTEKPVGTASTDC